MPRRRADPALPPLPERERREQQVKILLSGKGDRAVVAAASRSGTVGDRGADCR